MLFLDLFKIIKMLNNPSHEKNKHIKLIRIYLENNINQEIISR